MDRDAVVRFAAMTELFFLGVGMLAAGMRTMVPWMTGFPVFYMVLLALIIAVPVVVGREQEVDGRTAAAGTAVAVGVSVVLFVVFGQWVGQQVLMQNGFVAVGTVVDVVFGANPGTLTAMAWCAPEMPPRCAMFAVWGAPAVLIGGGLAVGAAYLSRRVTGGR